jgi:hypothetical protein
MLRPGAESLAHCAGHCFICGLYVAPPVPVPDDSSVPVAPVVPPISK